MQSIATIPGINLSRRLLKQMLNIMNERILETILRQNISPPSELNGEEVTSITKCTQPMLARSGWWKKEKMGEAAKREQ